MTRRLLIAILPAAFWMGLAPALPAADDLPAPDAIFDHFIDATGGKDAYEKQTSEVITGTLEFAAQGLKGTITRYAAPPDKYYSALDLAGIGKIEMGYTDGVAWEKSSIMGIRIKSGEEKAQALREATYHATYNWKKLFTKAEVAGVEKLNGSDCYKVVLTPKEGKPESMFFQKDSGLAVKITTVATSPMGEIPVEVLVGDYKKFGNILVASKTTQKAAGQEFTMTIDSVRSNEPISEERFALPAEVKAMLAKQTGNPK